MKATNAGVLTGQTFLFGSTEGEWVQKVARGEYRVLSGGPGVVTLGRAHRPQADAALLVAVVMVRLPASILNKILTR